MGSNEHQSWYSSGNELVKEGKNEDALMAYDKALELDPNHLSSWNNKGIVLSRLKRFEDAILCYDKAIEIDPQYANAWFNKANALRNFGQSLVDKANDDRTNAPKMINKSIIIFDLADKCYEKGEILSGKNNES